MLIFNKEFAPEYGKVIRISSLICRLVAPNPSPFTFYGTGTYIIGQVGVSDGHRGTQAAQKGGASDASGGNSSSEQASDSSLHQTNKGGASDASGGNSSSEQASDSSLHQTNKGGASDASGGTQVAQGAVVPPSTKESDSSLHQTNKKIPVPPIKQKVALIDPGPAILSHIQALEKFLETVTVSHILITHNHVDHSPAAHPLKLITGADIYGFDVTGQVDVDNHTEEGRDSNFSPDHILRDGDLIEGDGWTIEVVHTPGHLSNHLCFGLREEKALFTGDHVMGWSTSVVSQPDGDMKDYLASLDKLLLRDDDIYYPTHGAPIRNPKPYVAALIAHRHHREQQILDVLSAGAVTIARMVDIIYSDIPPYLHAAAASSLLSHLIHMTGDGRVKCQGTLNKNSIFMLF